MVDMAYGSEEPCYPSGLCIYLCAAEMEKLGIKAEDYKVGDVISLDAKAKIVGTSQREYGDSLDLQITDLGMETEDDKDAKPVTKGVGSRLYDGDD
jgi:hypothetical protein